MLERAYERIDDALAEGHLVCLFPEGGLTGDGQMGEFRRGVERIVRRRPVPVVPLGLGGLWGSLFSRHGGRAILKLPRRFWSRIRLTAGAPLAPEAASPEALQARVAELRGDNP